MLTNCNFHLVYSINNRLKSTNTITSGSCQEKNCIRRREKIIKRILKNQLLLTRDQTVKYPTATDNDKVLMCMSDSAAALSLVGRFLFLNMVSNVYILPVKRMLYILLQKPFDG